MSFSDVTSMKEHVVPANQALEVQMDAYTAAAELVTDSKGTLPARR
jgi:hypothetical protein